MKAYKRVHFGSSDTALTPGQRLASLDVFRGLTIALMVLVNSPGNSTAYAWLEHAAWNGCTPTDLVFPFFVFIVGMSLVFSLDRKLEQGASIDNLFNPILKRTVILFGIGLLLNGFPYYHLSTLRILGVLQRIALCYFFAACLYLVVRTEVLAALIGLLLVDYWMIMTRVAVPFYGAGNLTPEGNLASFIDQSILAGHMYRPHYDPEGLLSTGPAVATALIGVLAALGRRSHKTTKEKN